MTEQEFKALEKEIETAKAQSERARGAYDQLMRRLKEDYDCKTVKEAQDKLEALQARCLETERLFNKALTEYVTKWKRDDAK